MGILLGDHNLYELSYEQKFVRAVEKVTHPGKHITTYLLGMTFLLTINSTMLLDFAGLSTTSWNKYNFEFDILL